MKYKSPSNTDEKVTNKKEDLQKVEYDELLSSAGEFGRYQLLMFIATFPTNVFGAFTYFSQLFMTEVSQNHWCWIPELENLTDIERRNLAIPADPTSYFGYSRCQAYVANWSEILNSGLKPNNSWPIQSCQFGWEFNKSEIPYPTISSEHGWVCDKDSYQATAQSIFFVGSIVGGFLFGWVADRHGRLPALIVSNVIGFVAGIISIFATNLLQFSACRFLLGMSYDNCSMMMYLLLIEYVAPKYRTIVANLPSAIFFTLGVVTLPWISLACGHWRTISLATSIPMLSVVLAPLVIPESPRWLLSKGRVDEAIDKIKVIGQVNKKEVPLNLIYRFKNSLQNNKMQESCSCLTIFKNPILRRAFICMCVLFMTCAIIFDALVRTIGSLGYDFFLSFTFISATEFPSLLIISFVLDLTGRKWLSVVSLGITCIFSVLCAFIGPGLSSVICTVIARFFVNIAYNAALQWVAEILPTPVRASGSSMVHICGYIATVISPYIIYLQNYVTWLPLVIVGAIALIGGSCALVLPETAEKDIPHTLKDAEDLVKNQILFDIPFLRKKEVFDTKGAGLTQVMWLFRSTNMGQRLDVARPYRGPSVVATADGATPNVQVVSHMYNELPPKAGLANWLWNLMGRRRERREKGTDLGGEMQLMLITQDRGNSGDVCLLAESPFRILRAAESGNVEDFMRLYMSEPSRLNVRDARGRTPAHQAAARNNINILSFIHKYAGDLNAQDNVGNTPLHVAVENDALEAIEFLLERQVDTNKLNEKNQAVIHLATELNKVSVLQVFAKFKSQFHVDLGGEHGRTALHFAAIHDHDLCAQVLISDLNAECKRPCNNGYYPIHEAAKNASSRTMEVFLQWAESRGCTREQMLSLYDNEGNVPLHSAVHGGDIKAVELCLKSGAKISTQQHDFSTPVHLACAQGALDIVKLMFTMQPIEKMACLNSCDVQKMTPIHCAAMFDHPDIVSYLVSEGSDINPLDKERRSPLLLAASRGGWRTVHALIRLGANLELKDINVRNVLHLVVINGGRLEEFANNCKNRCDRILEMLLNEKDNTGCSPLHYASREGHIRSLENLIKLGACINLKNNKNESPLHFAARYGRYHTVCQLLDSDKGTFIINENDGEGLTPLHIASREGHTRVVQLLLNRGALLHRDHNGRNPLHLAAMSGYTQTIELLHSVHSHLLDQIDKDSNTPLHLATMENKPNSISLLLSMGCRLSYNSLDMSAIDYAIYYKFPEAALAMVTHEERAQEVMALRSDRHPCVTLALIAYMPRVFEAVQDKCITKANCKKDSKSFYIKYNFAALCPPVVNDDGSKKSDSIIKSPLPAMNIKYSFRYYQHTKLKIEALRQTLDDPKFRPEPLTVINAMVAHGRVELLAHPLSQKYLQMKWNSYGKYFHLTNLLFYCIFLVFVTLYGYLLMGNSTEFEKQTPKAMRNLNSSQDFKSVLSTKNNTNTSTHKIIIFPFTIAFETMVAFYASTVTILTYNCICLIRELYNIKQQKWHYLADPSNFVSWILYVSSTLMVWPSSYPLYSENLQYSAASITMFLSWFELLLLLQRFDQIGIYVVMFLEILQTLIKVLMVFSILIIAFGLSFYVLLSKVGYTATGHHLSFNSIPMALMRTFAMMLGELDFVGTYIHPYYKSETDVFLPFPLMTFFILGLFMVFMPILLMNLLIGLAVGDIESVRRNAQLKRLAMQVVLHTELERKLPTFILEKVDKNEVVEYPNNSNCKLGFLDTLLRKWFSNPFSEDASLDIVLESNEDYMASQLEKQKYRLREINLLLEQQKTLIRLIVQKMEIKTEADDVDEGISAIENRHIPRWNLPRIRKKLRSGSSFNKGI